MRPECMIISEKVYTLKKFILGESQDGLHEDLIKEIYKNNKEVIDKLTEPLIFIDNLTNFIYVEGYEITI